MTFRKLLQYLLVKKIRVSNKEALRLITTDGVLVNGVRVFQNIELTITDTVTHNNITLKKGIDLVHIAYYKPRGIECTMNTSIANNLQEQLPFAYKVFHVGRLDKESEGLLLLTNNGALHDALLRKEHSINKVYKVKVDKPLTPEFVQALRTGIVIMEQLTLPATVVELNEYEFSITLTQGLNRQIRRMCYKYNYEVIQLIRIGFANLTLDNLAPNEYQYVTPQAIVGSNT